MLRVRVHAEHNAIARHSAAKGSLMSSPLVAEASPEQATAPAFALGLGLTNECNLACAFCYRDPTRVDRLTLEQVRSVLGEHHGAVS